MIRRSDRRTDSADRMFSGNPAAVVLSESELAPGLMQSVAAENNLSETAFLVETQDGYRIRRFTPTVEVDLCGHATLAAAHVIFNHLGFSDSIVSFARQNVTTGREDESSNSPPKPNHLFAS
jgi:PhzF family phenazine biosynthesis protein